MPKRRTALAVSFLALCAIAAPLSADDSGFKEEFRRAELKETAFGDLDGAANLYRAASAKAGDAGDRAKAELRAGSCLRRLGRIDDAKALLAPLVTRGDVPDEIRRAARSELDAASIAAPAPPEPAPGPAADRKRLAETEHELEELRVQLDATLQRTQGLEKQTEDMAQKLLAQDKEIRAARAASAPASAEEALRVRIEEQERRHELSASYTSFARRLNREGQFAKARDFLFVALERDPENEEAKALLTLVSAPLGVRQRLYEVIRGALALAAEVRGARRSAEIDALVAEAKRRQDRQEFGPSVPPLETALALVSAGEPYLHDAAASRDAVLGMLRNAQAHGAQRSPAAPPVPVDDAETRGLAAVRELLGTAGGEVVHGLDLRFHEAGPALAAAAAGLAPSALAEPPVGWTISNETSGAAPLLVEYLRAEKELGFTAPGASLDAAGSTIVALCDAATQARLADRMSRLADVTAPAAELRVAAYRLPPGALASLLERRGIRLETAPGGARFAALPAADLDALAPDLAKRGELWPSVAALRATTLRPFRMVAGTTASSLSIDILPLTAPSAGVAVRVATQWTPPGRADGASLTQEATAGAVLDPGGGLVVLGLADPADPSRDLAIVVRQGVAPAAAATSQPPAGPALSSSEILLPASLRGLTEVGPVPIVVPSHPVPTREQALSVRIRAVAKSAQSVEVKADRVRVVGAEDARAAARRFIDQIDVVRGVQTFDVAMYVVSKSVEDNLLTDLPRVERWGATFARAIARSNERLTVERSLIGTGGRLPLLESRVSAPPTGRADAAYVLRSAYRRDLELAPGPDASWGRSETALADQGVLVAIRPFGRRETGRVDLDVGLRASWISQRGERSRDTALGPVVSLEPTVDTWWGDMSTTLADDELLVLAGLASPFGAGGERTRLVITIAVAKR